MGKALLHCLRNKQPIPRICISSMKSQVGSTQKNPGHLDFRLRHVLGSGQISLKPDGGTNSSLHENQASINTKWGCRPQAVSI